MTEVLWYILDLIASACGFDLSEPASLFGFATVVGSACVLIYASYRALVLSLSPGEDDSRHIKRQVLRDKKYTDAY